VAEPNDPGRRGRRRIPIRAIAVVAGLAVFGIALMLYLKSHGRGADVFTGYVVSDDIYMASPVAGTLAGVAVRRGQRIAAGAPLFRVDPTVRAAQADQARATIAAGQAQVEQQQSGLDRARADLAAAQADADRYGAQVRRLTAAQREKPGSVVQLEIDQARASHDGALRRRDASRAQLGAAAAAISAARAQVGQAQAGLVSAQRQLADLSPVAPGAGRVEDVMFKPGESVPANVPVIAIVPDGQVKVRFYVPQSLVNGYRPGRKVAIGCDGCRAGMTAVVDFVASRPEYTPPVIYSLDARYRLVFLVEAIPSLPRELVPGQPIDVAAAAGDLPGR
jgi:HlyD family secretion protein